MDASSSHCSRWAAATLVVAVAGLRLVYLAWFCPLDLAPDEAYYWDWSRQLDWSYQSKGPLVAWLIRASCEVFGATVLAIRVPAVVCGSLLLAGLYVLTVQVHRSERLGFGVVAVALTLPIVAAGSMLMTIDAPFTCAWTWALVFGHRAACRSTAWAWPMAGVCICIGLLAKHTMVLWLPSFVLFLLTTPAMRALLCRPGFWVMTGIGSLGGVPILLWNASHHWPMLRHTQIHAGLESDALLNPLGPLHFLATQFALMLGFWFAAWLWAMWQHRPTRESSPDLRFLWWMSAPTFVFFGVFSLKNGGGEANWPSAGYLAGGVLMAPSLARAATHSWSAYRRAVLAALATFAVLGLVLTAVLHEPIHAQPVLLSIAGPATQERPMPIRRVDPTCRLRGWRHLAAEIDRIRSELNARGIDPVLAAERWTLTAELRFYGADHPEVFCIGPVLGDRHTQYDLWRPNPIADADAFRGRTFLLVGVNLQPLWPAFDSFEPMEPVAHHENGVLVAQWNVVVAHGFRGWPNRDEPRVD